MTDITYKELLSSFDKTAKNVVTSTEDGIDKTVKKMTREAIEKQIPKKPIEQGTDEKTHYKCECGYIMLTVYADGYHLGNKPKYCERCGQSIDWEEVD